MRKGQSRRAVQAEIHAVTTLLRTKWDPIGDGQLNDLPDDEYESYAPAILGMLRRGDRDELIIDHLASVEMAITGGIAPRDLKPVVQELRAAVAAFDRSI